MADRTGRARTDRPASLDETSRSGSSSSSSRTAGAPTPRSARPSGCPRPRSASGCSGCSTPGSCRSSPSPTRSRWASRRQAMVGIKVDGDMRERGRPAGRHGEIDYVVITAGSFDLLVEVVCEDDEHLLELSLSRIRAIPGVRQHRDLRLPEAAQADLHTGEPDDDRPRPASQWPRQDSRQRARPPLDALHPACRPTTDGDVPVIVARRGRLRLRRPGQALPRRAGRAVRRCRSGTAARSSPRPAPGRRASWPTSRCGPTPTRRAIELAERLADLAPAT